VSINRDFDVTSCKNNCALSASRGFESETDTEEYEKIGQMMSIDKKPTHQSVCVGTIEPEFCDMATNMSVVLKRDCETVTDVSETVAVAFRNPAIIYLLLCIHLFTMRANVGQHAGGIRGESSEAIADNNVSNFTRVGESAEAADC
jgi:hypothetical protein